MSKNTLKNWIHIETDNLNKILKKHGEKQIKKEYDCSELSFPQTSFIYRNIKNWVLLEDNTAVGINESPRNGISLVVLSSKTVKRNLNL